MAYTQPHRCKAYKRTLRALSPEEWAARLKTVRNPTTRILSAQIIWWDYLANRPTPDPDAQPDPITLMLSAYTKYMHRPRKAIIRALTQCGYPSRVAVKRLSYANLYSPKNFPRAPK